VTFQPQQTAQFGTAQQGGQQTRLQGTVPLGAAGGGGGRGAPWRAPGAKQSTGFGNQDQSRPIRANLGTQITQQQQPMQQQKQVQSLGVAKNTWGQKVLTQQQPQQQPQQQQQQLSAGYLVPSGFTGPNFQGGPFVCISPAQQQFQQGRGQYFPQGGYLVPTVAPYPQQTAQIYDQSQNQQFDASQQQQQQQQQFQDPKQTYPNQGGQFVPYGSEAPDGSRPTNPSMGVKGAFTPAAGQYDANQPPNQ